MSKKKATMTLKDFHGGSIPSDLPLPSAPGVMARPADRGGFDRQTSWGNPAGRSEHRLRPTSAGSVRNLDDKTPFLSHSAHIGRNFDEDERKPLDGVSGPRRTVSDENIHAQQSGFLESKMEYLSGSNTTSFQVSQLSNDSMGISYARKHNELQSGGLNSQKFNGSVSAGLNYAYAGDSTGKLVIGSNPNAWGLRKETAAVKQPVFSAWSAPDAELKLAHASALEKVSSGRWSSKEHVGPQKDGQILGHQETKEDFLYKSNSLYAKNNCNSTDVIDAINYNDITLAMLAEKNLVVDDVICGGGKEIPPYERLKPTTQMELYEGNPLVNSGFHILHSIENSGSAALHSSSLPSEPSGRPKLKLLPRSKPLENIEPPVDYKQGHQQPSYVHVEDNHGVDGSKYTPQPSFTGSLVVDRTQQRQKLNLKPRSQHLDPLEGISEIKRGAVFGGTRPREEILLERGIDDAVSSHGQPPFRAKEAAPKTNLPPHVTPRYGEKVENVKYTDRRDYPTNGERNDSQVRNRQIESRKINREAEKHRNQQQQPQDRPPSPETWCKPVEPPKPVSPDAPSLRYGKAASAVELAQSFSKSVSDQTLGDRFSGSKGLQKPGQIPFSRLAGPAPRPQINGY